MISTDQVMKKLKLSKGFTPLLAGLPDQSVIRLPEPQTVAVSAMDIPYIRPRLLVKKKDPVKIGTPLFSDKRMDHIRYVSPGSGHVKEIVFGPRRKLIEVIIQLDRQNEAIQFEPVRESSIHDIPKADLVKQLQEGGLWQCFRQFPSKDTADDTHTPPMIIVSLNGNDLFSPHPGLVLENELTAFKFGLKLLRRFCETVVVTARETSLQGLADIEEMITHAVPDRFPSWDPGVVLYRLKRSVEDNLSWCISAEHLILIGNFFLTGVYPVKRVVSVTRPHDKKPHIITRQGVPVKNLIGQIEQNAVVTTGRFNGRMVDPETHLGFFESTLNIIDTGDEDEFFGFMMPGFNKATVSRTFVSSLFGAPRDMDANYHGEERACINCGYCTNICPVDLMPSFIMKALYSDDIEDALNYGILDCCRCGLCSYTCPSKIELTHILSEGMDAYYKDKE